MKYKKCPKCELNYISEDEDLCETCKETLKKTVIGKSHAGILENQQLGGQRFNIDLSGYGLYLKARNYGVFTKQRKESTTMAYVRAVVRICQDEKMSFEELLQEIEQFVKIYGLNGAKKDKGQIRNGTWRNALNRLQDFNEYIKIYMK